MRTWLQSLLCVALLAGCINEDKALQMFAKLKDASAADGTVAELGAGEDADGDSAAAEDADIAVDAASDAVEVGVDAEVGGDASETADGDAVTVPQCVSATDCNDGKLCTDDVCNIGKCSNTPNTAACEDGSVCTVDDQCKDAVCEPGTPTPCDDGHVCTDDSCDSSKGCKHTDKGGPCDDGDFCTVKETCQNGGCLPSAFLECNDKNPCTSDWCDSAQGCKHDPDGGSCSDGDTCTLGDHCAAGTCAGGAPANCEDGNPCTADACNPANGCSNTPTDGGDCDDGNACTSGDHCGGGLCLSGAVTGCDDANLCTLDVCSPGSGCQHVPNPMPCQDGNLCTISDMCAAGACVPGAKLWCDDDGNVCTDDICDAASGCEHFANSAACDDGSNCTVGEACSQGSCKSGVVVSCDDGNGCTTETCDGLGGCTQTNNDLPCGDGNVCTIGDHCSGGVCLPGETTACSDGNPCTTDLCHAIKGCTFAVNLSPCSDGNTCTTGDSCHDGVCLPAVAIAPCDDGQICTTDSCLPQSGCTHVANSTFCNDGNACTVGDTCAQGVCGAGGKALWCDDAQPCTSNGCLAESGCSFPVSNGPCDDGMACTQNDTCVNGACQAGGAANCDDNDGCTADFCNGSKGCIHMPTDAVCDDGNPCTDEDWCKDGACKGTGTTCDDGNPCTTDSCSTTTGCKNAFNSLACDDGSKCTGGDTCKGGNCQAGTAIQCDDGNACTDDSCDKANGCVNAPGAATCTDGNVCTTDSCDTGSGCKFVANTLACDDGNACTQTDTCQSAACKGSNPVVCTAKDQCHDVGTCDSLTGTCGNPSKSDGSSCTDGSACTVGDACSGGACLPGATTVCDDGNVCTTDTCDPGSGCTFDANTLGCNDGNACTLTDTCQGGNCAGSSSVVCTALDQCHEAGTCATASGQCSNPPKSNGTSCNDENLCTKTDTCGNGVCGGADLIICQAKDACHVAGTCDATTGACSEPLAQDGTACNDGDPCTKTDGCKSGVCEGTSYACEAPDQCHEAGVCAGDGTCTFANKADTTVCNDGVACTQNDKCSSGVCGGAEYTCAAPDQCHEAGVCAGDGTCTNPLKSDGSSCTDGDSCTQTDACQDGACVGGNPIVCMAKDQCHDIGTCSGGTCSDPAKVDKTACDDGQACTLGEACVGGVCSGGSALYDSQFWGAAGDVDIALAVTAVADGGFVVAGTSQTGTKGADARLVRFGSAGGVVWDQRWDDQLAEEIQAVAALPDGYAVAGRSTSKAKGGWDGWFVRTDLQGNRVGPGTVDVRLGGTQDDDLRAVVPLADGFALAGRTMSKGAGNIDFWLLRADLDGKAVVDVTYGGAGEDAANALVALPDGFALVGYSFSHTKGGADLWVVRTDSAGGLLWSQNYGDLNGDSARGVVAADGGLAVAGYQSNGSKNQPWLLRLDPQGFVLWQRLFPMTGDYLAYALQKTPGGFALAGAGNTLNAGWFAETDDRGNIVQQQTYSGGNGFFAMAATADGFALVGDAGLAASKDFWLVRTDAWGHATCADSGVCLGAGACDDENACTLDSCDAVKGCQHVNLADGLACAAPGSCDAGGKCSAGSCVATGDRLFNATYGGTGNDAANAIVALPNGFAMAGLTASTGAGQFDGWLVRTDPAGNMLWTQTYGGIGIDVLYPLMAMPDGFAMAGYTESKGNGGADAWLVRTDSNGKMLWDKVYGGSSEDVAYFLVSLSNGFLLSGYTGSKGAGDLDAWLVQTDANGNPTWDQAYGGPGTDIANQAVALPDGIAFAGATKSSGAGDWDFWLVRTDADGSLMWQRTYGGAGTDYAIHLLALPDGGFAMGGITTSKGAGKQDFWLVRTDAAGELLWEHSYGGAGDDRENALVAVSHGAKGFALAGWSTFTAAGGQDIWMVRTDAVGNELWNRTWGGAGNDQANRLAVLDDGFAVAGSTASTGAGANDAWLLRTDLFGNVTCATSGTCAGTTLETCDDHNDCTADLCDAGHGGCYHQQLADGSPCPDAEACSAGGACKSGKCASIGPKLFQASSLYSGSAEDSPSALLGLPDGGFAFAGATATKSAGGLDCWFVRTDAAGSVVSDKRYGATGGDACLAVAAVQDGFSLAGSTAFHPDGFGNDDVWLVRIDGQGNKLWDRPYGGTGYEWAQAVAVLPDGLAVAGPTNSKGNGLYDCWLIVVHGDGSPDWDKTYGGAGGDVCRALAALPANAGFALAGATSSKGAGNTDAWLVRTDPNGVHLWDATYGDTGEDAAQAVVALADGFALAGYSFSSAGPRFFVVRTDASGNALWTKKLGGTGYDFAYSIAAAPDGFVLGGLVSPVAISGSYSLALTRTDTSGNELWTKTFASTADTRFALATLDDGFAMVSRMIPQGKTDYDAVLLRTDAFGNLTCGDSGTCITTPTCDDQNPCTADVCDASHGGCWHSALDLGTGCPDFGLCDGNGKCVTVAGKSGIPSGSFLMGCVPGDADCKADAKPQHGVMLDAYFLDIYEVTVEKYKACVDKGKCTAAATTASCNSGVAGRDQHPVNCVTWDQASTFCASSGDVLPTEAQWERAARGGADGSLYPTGNTIDCALAVFDDGSATTGQGCDAGSTMPVGSKAAGKNAYGLYDVIGNVWEWVGDWYDSTAYGSGPTVNPSGPAGGSLRGARGLSWYNKREAANDNMATAFRSWSADAATNLGFRCARPFTPCTDNNPCTTDTPDGKGACTHTPLAVGSPCPGGLCNLEAKCAAAPQGMSAVPAGTFWMGCNSAKDANCQADESPQHKVTLTTSYFMDTTETTVAQYRACVLAGKCSAPAAQQPEPTATYPGLAKNPVNYVNWDQARAFCQQKGGDLPTEAQWEMAARGRCEENGSTANDPNCKAAMRTYPWGEAPADCSRAVLSNGTAGCGTATSWAVGSKPAGDSPYGLHDMVGNAFEWCSDGYGPYTADEQADPTGPGSTTIRLDRGGSWGLGATALRAGSRSAAAPAYTDNGTGFRCIQPFAPCDDGNPCTTDTPTGPASCSHTAISTGSACPGGLCNASATCVQAPAGMAAIPAGTFWMGCNSAKEVCDTDDIPQHKVTLSGHFMDMNETTVAAYRACVDSGVCLGADKIQPEPYATYPGYPDMPVNFMGWVEAQKYCQWRGPGFDLPTEAQWEMTARGRCEENGSAASSDGCKTAMRPYPWGEAAADCTRVVMLDSNNVRGCGTQQLAAVGSKAAGDSPFGVHDLEGNVFEWVRDFYGPYAADAVSDPTGPATGEFRVNRGSAYSGDAGHMRSSYRSYQTTAGWHYNGFRCIRTLTP